MSLKAFHIVFVTASTLLAFGFGAWALWQYFGDSRALIDLVMGVVSVLAGVALIVYGKFFLKKLKHISYL
ncbi:MAG: hypothetical protein HY043_20640 [Verrucomicrobia bacterium]|nr:hypothetical protein [Verrucomicrobiota bacterium]